MNFLTQGNILVQTDSFAFCQSNRILQRTMIGGFLSTIAMELNGNLKDSFKFESGDIGENTFDLLNYLYAYKLLKDKLPDKFPKARLFTEDSFKNNIAYYLQTIECEDYYYKEFVKLHPERTAKQNRMWDGWDYKQFLKYRGINK